MNLPMDLFQIVLDLALFLVVLFIMWLLYHVSTAELEEVSEQDMADFRKAMEDIDFLVEIKDRKDLK